MDLYPPHSVALASHANCSKDGRLRELLSAFEQQVPAFAPGKLGPVSSTVFRWLHSTIRKPHVHLLTLTYTPISSLQCPLAVCPEWFHRITHIPRTLLVLHLWGSICSLPLCSTNKVFNCLVRALTLRQDLYSRVSQQSCTWAERNSCVPHHGLCYLSPARSLCQVHSTMHCQSRRVLLAWTAAKMPRETGSCHGGTRSNAAGLCASAIQCHDRNCIYAALPSSLDTWRL